SRSGGRMHFGSYLACRDRSRLTGRQAEAGAKSTMEGTRLAEAAAGSDVVDASMRRRPGQQSSGAQQTQFANHAGDGAFLLSESPVQSGTRAAECTGDPVDLQIRLHEVGFDVAPSGREQAHGVERFGAG